MITIDSTNGYRVAHLLLKRDPSKDYIKDDINFFGLDIYWQDGVSASVQFAHFCTAGVSTIFGKNVVIPKGEYDVKFYFIPVYERSPRSAVEGSHKVRRMYAWKENGKVAFHFRRGIPTIMVFTEEDEDRVKQWMNFDIIKEGQKYWFDFAATVEVRGNFVKRLMTKLFFIIKNKCKGKT